MARSNIFFPYLGMVCPSMTAQPAAWVKGCPAPPSEQQVSGRFSAEPPDNPSCQHISARQDWSAAARNRNAQLRKSTPESLHPFTRPGAAEPVFHLPADPQTQSNRIRQLTDQCASTKAFRSDSPGKRALTMEYCCGALLDGVTCGNPDRGSTMKYRKDLSTCCRNLPERV